MMETFCGRRFSVSAQLGLASLDEKLAFLLFFLLPLKVFLSISYLCIVLCRKNLWVGDNSDQSIQRGVYALRACAPLPARAGGRLRQTEAENSMHFLTLFS